MSASRKRRKQASSAKYLIASLSIAAAIIIWSMLSTRDQLADVMATNEDGSGIGTPGQNIELVLDPLPTLIPLHLPNEQELIASEGSQPESAQLRSVSAPQQKVQQVSGGPIIVSNNGGGGGDTGGGDGGGGGGGGSKSGGGGNKSGGGGGGSKTKTKSS